LNAYAGTYELSADLELAAVRFMKHVRRGRACSSEM
jgi:hypothetical protein